MMRGIAADAPLQRLQVSNCTLKSKSAAIKIGSESRSNMSGMVFEDIEVWQACPARTPTPPPPPPMCA